MSDPPELPAAGVPGPDSAAAAPGIRPRPVGGRQPASPRSVVIEPAQCLRAPRHPRAVDGLGEETPGAPPAAEGDEDTFKY